MTGGDKRILVLYSHADPSGMRLAIARHLRVFDWSSRKHDVLYVNAVNGAPAWLRHLAFDVVVLHTTLLCKRWDRSFPLWKWKLRWIEDLPALKVALPQDEYDHAEVLDEWLYEWNVGVVFTNFDRVSRRLLYPIMSSRASFYECFTGYIDESDARRYAKQARSHGERPHDIVYRGSDLPYWFGSHGQLKHEIGARVGRQASGRGLSCNISTKPEDTVVGPAWLDFLASGRAALGCESGSSVLDARGAIRARIQAALGSNSDLTFEEIDKRMPVGWDDYQFFAVSPRHFEAVMTGTCQILIEGLYNGVLHPHHHYVPLARDFSNLDEVLDQVRDRHALERMAARAYEDVYGSGRYSLRIFAELVDRAIDEHASGRPGGRSAPRGLIERARWRVARPAARLLERRPRAVVALEHLAPTPSPGRLPAEAWGGIPAPGEGGRV